MNRKSLEVRFRRWLKGQAEKQSGPFYSLNRSDYAHLVGEGDIDHIIPLSFFDLSQPAAILLAWSPTNLRRMPNGENRNKSAAPADALVSILTSEKRSEVDHRELALIARQRFAAQYPSVTIEVTLRL